MWNRLCFPDIRFSVTRRWHCGICIHRERTAPFLPSCPERTKITPRTILTCSKRSSAFTPDLQFVSCCSSHLSSDSSSSKARFTRVSSSGSSYKRFFPNPQTSGVGGGERSLSASFVMNLAFFGISFVFIVCQYSLKVESTLWNE